MCLHSHMYEIYVSNDFVGTIPWGSGEPKGYFFNLDCAVIYVWQKNLVIYDYII